MSKLFKFNATIELPDDVDPFDLIDELTDVVEGNKCEWCVTGQITENEEGA